MNFIKYYRIFVIKMYCYITHVRRFYHLQSNEMRFLLLILLLSILVQTQTTVARASVGSSVMRGGAHTIPLARRSPALAVSQSVGANTLGRKGWKVLSDGVLLLDEVVKIGGGNEHLCIIDLDLNNPNVRLGLVQAHNHLVSPDEPLSSMANRTKALVGINGDYFQIGGPGRPIGMEISNGRLVQTPTNDSFYAVLGISGSGKLSMRPEFFSGTIIAGKASYPLHEVNIYSDIHKGPILITPDLGSGIPVGGDTVVMLRPVADVPDSYTVLSVRSGIDWLPALSKQDAIIAEADDGDWLASHLHKNQRISLKEEIAPDSRLFQAIGGGPVVLKDGTLYYDEHPPVAGLAWVRNPITAIGVSRDGTHAIVAVFDGRGAGRWRSVGVTYEEAVSYLRRYGAYNAMLFDTGGSTELVTRMPGHKQVSIINAPSQGSERPVANGLFVYETGITDATTIPCKSCNDDPSVTFK